MKKLSRWDYRDAYAYQHAQRRKDANISRQAVLKQERAEALGDPIRGVLTPFVQSFDIVGATPFQPDQHIADPKSAVEAAIRLRSSSQEGNDEKKEEIGHFIHTKELLKSLEASRLLTEPIPLSERATADPEQEASDVREHNSRHIFASEAMKRIFSLSNAGSRQRTRANIQKIIDTFGRHHTDHSVRPKATAVRPSGETVRRFEATPRAGPDVGSSEVQIGILTAKIRVLADRYEGKEKKNKVLKRNLRLLLHRRQKLLRYMYRKERGSGRWQNMVEKLGITEANWKGQIEVR